MKNTKKLVYSFWLIKFVTKPVEQPNPLTLWWFWREQNFEMSWATIIASDYQKKLKKHR